MPYDYAPRLARLARARRRRHMVLTAGLLMLTALSFNASRSAAENPAIAATRLAQDIAHTR